MLQATNPYLTGMPQVGNTYSPYFAPSPIMPTIMGPADPSGVASPLGVAVPQTVAMPQKMPRTDRLEVCLPATNYMRQVAAAVAAQQQGCHPVGPAPGPPRAAPPPPPPQVYQTSPGAASSGAPPPPQPQPQSRVSPVSTITTIQSQCHSHNQSPSPTALSHAQASPLNNNSCTGAAAFTSGICAPLQHHNPAHPGPLHSPLQNLVYVHTYYEGPYVPIYVRT